MFKCYKYRCLQLLFARVLLVFMCQLFYVQIAVARDLAEIQAEGVLRHIGIPYSNFIAYSGKNGFQTLSGLDVDLMQGFAHYLGVEYQFVSATMTDFFGKLTGQEAVLRRGEVVLGETNPIQGDVVACGMTILDWRAQVIDFSDDYFPSGVWLLARSDSDLEPIVPTGTIEEDIIQVKKLMKGRDVLTLDQSCVDSNLYNLRETGANIIYFDSQRNLNELAPAILNNDAELALVDVADALIALEKWSGEIKVLGPVSPNQLMASMFRKDSPLLREEFNHYLQTLKNNGVYERLIEKYYPSVFFFYSEYFEQL